MESCLLKKGPAEKPWRLGKRGKGSQLTTRGHAGQPPFLLLLPDEISRWDSVGLWHLRTPITIPRWREAGWSFTSIGCHRLNLHISGKLVPTIGKVSSSGIRVGNGRLVRHLKETTARIRDKARIRTIWEWVFKWYQLCSPIHRSSVPGLCKQHWEGGCMPVPNHAASDQP